jgi:hypothetical protein
MRFLPKVLATALLVSACAATASAKTPPVAFAGCLGPSVRPMDVLLACGDGTESFEVTRWTRWTRRSARAVGSAAIDDCDPSCVAGHTHSFLATLTLDRPRACHGRLRFTRLRIVFAQRPVRGQPAPVTYSCR